MSLKDRDLDRAKRGRSGRVFAAALLLPLLAVSASAQDRKTTLDTIVIEGTEQQDSVSDRNIMRSDLNAPNAVGSRLPGTARDIPASLDSTNQAPIQQRGKDNWTDTLEGLTGIKTASRPGAAGIADL